MRVSARSRGMLNDRRFTGCPANIDFSEIKVPTLIVSVEDDRFGTAQTAKDIAKEMTAVKLVIYPLGGHIWSGHDEDLADEIAEFTKEGGLSL